MGGGWGVVGVDWQKAACVEDFSTLGPMSFLAVGGVVKRMWISSPPPTC
jgi:hypothetical protein